VDLSASICLISNRNDVINFCGMAIGCLDKIRVMEELSVTVCSIANLVLIDAEILRQEKQRKFWEQQRTRFRNTICLLPPDCTNEYKMEISQYFKLVIPLPCEASFFKKLVTDLENCLPPDQNPSLLINQNKQNENPVFQNFLGKSPLLNSVKHQLEVIALSDRPVLLVGETGTGKSTVARFIHDLSARKNECYDSISIPHISEELICLTLFGTKKGAYTDAIEREGLFKTANKGTVFLDEIGFASPKIQGNLLTFIETGVFRSMGSKNDEKVDVRLIFATNENLSKMRKEGSFREDFYQRIAGFKIYLPALRDHIDDLEEIIAPLLYAREKTIDKYALEKLMNHHWPGNIRELKNCIDYACSFCQSSEITADYIFFDL